ncbi:2-dehydro-3-deoxygluconokinase [Pseudoduganella lurida]|uniref:2-dehydro-3-deoxygluconokinase n=1 Tax=Pseudoduganella lurida TaxID=1036180 RepID=A0A562RLN5_9BURK|nr:sugar kinase [Pseudoduganella lurida]TWI69514.1 2-dehydro-3-deoxygluconokinase [Pseudoduganella lurida]
MTAAPERRFDLIAIGECMVEFHATEPLATATAFRKGCGGDTLNALVTAARQGGRTAFVTRVGDDPFGAGLRAAWQNEGVDVSQAPLVPGENGVYFISLDAHGERSFTYRRAGSAPSTLDAAHIDEAFIASARCVLLSGITQAISPSARAATLAAARYASKHGVLVAYDPNYRPRLWSGAAAAHAACVELLPFVDILLPSLPADADVLPGAPQHLVRHAVVKHGEAGCEVFHEGERHVVPAAPARVVDTTGAGDAFNGAYLTAFLRGLAPPDAAALANRVAAAKLAHRGAIPPREG